MIDALKFLLNKFLMVHNFDEIEEHSDHLQPLTPELEVRALLEDGTRPREPE